MIIGGWRGPGWRVTDADTRLGGQVRRWITSVIAAHGCPASLDDAALVTGELFANAVLHGPGGRVLSGYCLWAGGARIVVCDGGGPGEPVLRRGGDVAGEGSRGLRIVDELAARWGSFRLAGARVVWADLGQPLRVPHADAWAWLHRELESPSA